MTGQPKIRDITVQTKRNPAGQPPLLFSIDHSKLTFRNQNHPGFSVQFKIDDSDGNGYLFPTDKLQAMWVQPVDAVGPDNCPVTVTHWNGFAASAVVDQNKTLEVSNPNGPLHNKSEQLFGFTLRFTLAPNDPAPLCVPFDPLGTNKNGPAAKNTIAPVIAILVVIGIAAFAAYELFLK